MRTIKDTEHSYKGFEIKGRNHRTIGGHVLGGRHYKGGGIKRQYFIVKDGIKYWGGVIDKLSDAKEIIDTYYLK